MATIAGYEKLTSLAASTALANVTLAAAPAIAKNTMRALIIPETQAIRWRADGIAPTATIGQPLAVGQELRYDGDLSTLRMIEQVASAAVNVTYYY